MKNSIKIPSILETNTFFFNSATSASHRRWRENSVQLEVITFLYNLGFLIDITKSNNDNFWAEKDDMRIHFFYYESARNIYKGFKVWVGGKKSNIRAFRKVVDSFNQTPRKNTEIRNLDIYDVGGKKTIIYGNPCFRFRKVFNN